MSGPDLAPVPEDIARRLTSLELTVVHLREEAIRKLAREPGPIGDYVREYRPDLAAAHPAPSAAPCMETPRPPLLVPAAASGGEGKLP